MEKKKINYGLIIFIIVLVILFLPIIIDYFNSRKITVISSDELNEKINNSESFVVYVGEVDKNIAKELRTIRDKKGTDYAYKYSVYSIKNNESVEEVFGEDTKVAFVIEGDIQKVYTEYDYSIISEYADIYLLANITNDNKSYKVAESYSDYKKLVKSDDVIMAVFGRDTCSYCNLFKVVYNAVAEKYGVDIYFFDSDSYDSNDYTKIVNMDLTVPAKCSSSGVEFNLSDGFGTPLTVFTQDGEIIDCIGGYVNRKTLIAKLNELEMISE